MSGGMDSRSPIGVGDKLTGNDGLLSRIQYRFRRLIIVTRQAEYTQNRESRLLRQARMMSNQNKTQRLECQIGKSPA